MSNHPPIPYRDLLRQSGSLAIFELTGVDPPKGVVDGILDYYDDPGRHYHNINHLGAMALVMKSALPSALFPHETMLAILFHDAVYDPRSKDNVEQSAEQALHTLMPLGIPRTNLDVIHELILCTKRHAPTECPDSALMIDSDLAILGSVSAEYGRYAAAIRNEYSFVREEEYRIGRTQVLRSFLDREFIFLMPWFRERFEARARANIAAEIASLVV